MNVLTNKLWDIYNQLSSLLPQFKNINVINLSSLSRHIVEIVVGENKIPLWVNKSITSVTEDDLNNVTSIGYYAFFYCTSLESVTIPEGVTSIDGYAFFYCTNLKSVTIPSSVTSIGDYAFSYCTSLESVTIPEGVTSIDDYAFRYCSRLTDIYLNPITPPSLGNIDAIPTTTTIHVPIGSGDAYKSATNWSYHSSRIVEDIEI